MRSTFRDCFLLATSLLLASACGGDSDPSARLRVNASAAAASQLVGPGDVVLDVPAGASDEDVTIVLSAPSGRRQAPAGTTAVATPIRLTPEGQTFNKPLEVTIPIEPASLPAPYTLDDVVVVRAPQGSGQDAFVPLPTRRQGNAVVCQTEHFSDFIPVVIDAANSPFGACGDDVCLPSESCDACPHDCGLCLPSSDTTGPSVSVRLAPAAATMVRGDAVLSVQFDENVMPASVADATVSLARSGGTVPGTLAVQGSVVTFTPTVLLPSTGYDLKIDGVRDLAGNLMSAPYSFTFTTDTAITLTGASPASGSVGLPQQPFISFSFSANPDPSFVLDLDSDDGPCTAAIQVSADGFATCLGSRFTEGGSNDLVILPAYKYPANATLAIRFTPAARDPNGFLFSDIVGAYSVSTGPDTSPPHVVTMTPYGGQTDFPLGTNWVIEFDEPVSITAAGTRFELTVGASNPVFGSLSVSGRIVTFTPMTPFTASTTYNFLVDGVQDLAGNVMPSPSSGSFDSATPPTVSGSSPTNAKVGVHPRQDIVLVFSESVDATTFTMQAADGPCTGSVQLTDGTTCYGGTLQMTSGSATIQASTSLPFLANMTVSIGTAATDANAVPFAGGIELSFRVSPVMDFAYAMRSSSDVTGSLGGIVGADSLCDSQFPGTKAFLMSAARYPCTTTDCIGSGPAMDWVLTANTQYVDVAGLSLFRTDALQPIFTAWPMDKAYSTRMWNFLWGGTGGWTPSGLDCAGWTDGATASMSVGYEFSSTNGFINGGMLGCSGARPVLCVEPVPGVLPATH